MKQTLSRWMLLALCAHLLVVGCGSSPPDVTPSTPTFAPPAPTTTHMPPAPSPVPPTATAASPTDTPRAPTPATPSPEPPPEPAAQGFLLKGAGLRTPESVLYDSEADLYLVANINGSPSDKDGNGFISRVSPDGALVALKWIDGAAQGATPFTLDAPKGMALFGDRFYVTDIDAVRAFDRATGAWLADIPVPDARFLNDLAAGGDGTLYVTDSATGVVHRILPDGTAERATQVKNPNGIDVRGEEVLFTGGSNQIFRLGRDGALTPAYEVPSGGLDGLVLLDDGGLLVSSWMGAAVYHIDAGGVVTELFTGINAPADIGFDTKRAVVLIPHFEDDRVEAKPLPASENPAPAEARGAPVEVTRDLPYVDGGHRQHKLDLYLPASGGGPLPTLLMLHGGGRDKMDLAQWARHLAEQGYAALSINYRDMNQFEYPASVQDAFCALAWTHANADEYGLDATRVFALGHSMGGTLTAMLGTVDDPSRFAEGCPHQLPQSALVAGAIPLTGIFDYVSAAQSSSERRARTERYLGAKQSQAPDKWAETSAKTWIDGSEPPFLLVHGTDDDIIKIEQSIEFAEALEGAGVQVELLLIPGADHGGILRSPETLEAVERFLARHS